MRIFLPSIFWVSMTGWMPSLLVMLSASFFWALFRRSMPVTAWSLSLAPRTAVPPAVLAKAERSL